MPKNHNREQDIKIAEIGTDVKWIKTEIMDIKENHLKGIYQQLNAQKNILISTLITTIILLVGIIFQILAK